MSLAERHGAKGYQFHAELKVKLPDQKTVVQQLLMIHRDASQSRI